MLNELLLLIALLQNEILAVVTLSLHNLEYDWSFHTSGENKFCSNTECGSFKVVFKNC